MGLWFGLAATRGKEEFRPFKVPRRDAVTLIPIIQANVVPGSTIYSDEWAAYRQLNALGFRHETVNRTQQFVNHLPTGEAVHTQKIENRWGQLKLKIMKCMHGTSANIDSHIAEAWWWSIHTDNDPVFLDFVEEIKLNYPIMLPVAPVLH